MNLIFVPDWRANPYQKELAEALADLGHHVSFGGRTTWGLLAGVPGLCKADILHVHWIHPYFIGNSRALTILKTLRTFSELWLLKRLGVSVLWTVHNLFEHEHRHPSLERSITRRFVRLCNAVIVHGEAARGAVIQEYGLPPALQRQIHVIPHGHYIGSYRNEIGKPAARAELGLGQDCLVFLHLGQIRDYKGIPELIDAIRQLPQERLRLVIAGRPQNQATRQLVDTLATQDSRIQVHWGFVPDDEIQVYMSAADAVVLPYRDILTSGGAVLAMSFGKPVIAPSLGCVPETVNGAGILYDADTPTGLLDALRKACDVDLSLLGRQGFKIAQTWDWSRIAQETSAVYQAIRNKTANS